MVAMLARNIQINHATLSEHITRFRDGIPALRQFSSKVDPVQLALIDMEVNHQASMSAYLNDFRLMMWICIAAMPLVLLMRNPYRRMPEPVAIAPATTAAPTATSPAK
jgi:DHA2 family multidrug resistance protein